MTGRRTKRSLTVWGVLVMLIVALMLPGCGGEGEPTEPNEPNAMTAAPASAEEPTV